MFDDLRTSYSLRQIEKALNSQYTYGQWGKYGKEKIELTRIMRGELRAAMNLDPLPLTITEAMAHVSPDAQVIQVGEEPLTRVILAGNEPVMLFLNGDVTAVTPACQPKRKREPVYRPALPPEFKERIKDSGLTIREVIEKGLNA